MQGPASSSEARGSERVAALAAPTAAPAGAAAAAGPAGAAPGAAGATGSAVSAAAAVGAGARVPGIAVVARSARPTRDSGPAAYPDRIAVLIRRAAAAAGSARAAGDLPAQPRAGRAGAPALAPVVAAAGGRDHHDHFRRRGRGPGLLLDAADRRW